MCGICGILLRKSENDHFIFDYTYKSLYLLQSRGYDSVGMATFSRKKAQEFEISKYSISDHFGSYIFDMLSLQRHRHYGNVSIGHTRWATRGETNDKNAHPHVSNHRRIIVVHNGMIENYDDLHKRLCEHYVFSGNSDSEVIPILLESLEKENPSDPFDEIIRRASEMLMGIWSCVILHMGYPDTIFFMKNKMPLVISKNGSDATVLISDPNGFIDPTISEYYLPSDRTYGYVHDHKIAIFEDNIIKTNNINRYVVLPWDTKNIEFYEKNRMYENWTHQNIATLPKVIRESSTNLYVLHPYEPMILKFKKVCLVGTSTSYYVAQCIRTRMYEFECFESINVVNTHSFTPYDIDVTTCYILISQSSESREIGVIIDMITSYSPDIVVIGVFNNMNGVSSLRTFANIPIGLGIDRANSMVYSFVGQYLALYTFSIWIRDRKRLSNQKTNDNNTDHHDIRNQITEIQDISYSRIVQFTDRMCDRMFLSENLSKNILIVAKDHLYWVAKEASLRIKNMAHMWSDTYNLMDARHYEIYSVIQKNTVVLILFEKNKNVMFMRNFYYELISKNFISSENIFVCTDDPNFNHGCEKNVYRISYLLSSSSPISTDIAILNFHYHMLMIAYLLSQKVGNDPDRPRSFITSK
jgi:glucosamine--fructose-6-phosphate aminotransferase (isomerizing)